LLEIEENNVLYTNLITVNQ